jgi:3-hydroxyacyl-[acyl-carrier-protein] dehydratase
VTRPATISLAWGPEQIERLLPHRDPLRLVDRIDRFVPGPRPRLRAGLSIDGTEPVFHAHVPGRPIWPGVYLLEGLAQAAGWLLGLERRFASHGAAGLPAFAERCSPDLDVPDIAGLLARADIAFLRPVEPPAELVYELRRRGGAEQIERIDGRVEVDGQAVAEGSLVIALQARGRQS